MALGDRRSPPGRLSSSRAGDAITWAADHLLRLSDPEEHNESFKRWSFGDLPMSWPISHTPVAAEYRSRQLEVVIRLARRADEIVHARNPDPEGQRLIDEIIEYAGLAHKPIRRVLINDNTPAMVRKAINALEDNARYRGLSLSVLARTVCDQCYSYNLTRAYTLQWRRQGGKKMLSVERVQPPILGLIVSRSLTGSTSSTGSKHFIPCSTASSWKKDCRSPRNTSRRTRTPPTRRVACATRNLPPDSPPP